MPLQDANIPDLINAGIEVDLSSPFDFVSVVDLKDYMLQLDTTGGDYTYEAIKTWAATYVGLGQKNLAVWTLTLVYTDGETADAWESLEAAEGAQAAIRFAPKGTPGTDFTHTLTGYLVDVSDPTPAGETYWQFTAVFVGTTVGA